MTAPQPVQALPDKTATPRRRGGSRSTVRVPILLILPAIAFYLFSSLVPAVRGALYGFTDWDGLSYTFDFIGLDNFRRLFSDATSVGAVTNTLLLTLVVVIAQNAIGLALALALNTQIKSRNVLRTLFFAPVVMTPVAIGFLWRNLLSPNGAVNEGLNALGLSGLTNNWLGDPQLALWTIAAIVVWQMAGYSMVIYLAGLQGVPKDLIEASMLDGAGAWRRFVSVVLPMLRPALTISLVLSIITTLKLFDQVWVMTGGGPGGSTETMSTLLYRTAFVFGDYGLSTAMALVLSVIVIAVTSVQYKALNRR